MKIGFVLSSLIRLQREKLQMLSDELKLLD